MNDKQKAFAEYYATNPNATEAAKFAGYSEKTARSQGQRLLTNVDIMQYIKKIQEESAEKRIVSISEVKAFWCDIMNSPSEKTTDRLKASELFAKASGAFLHINQNGENNTTYIHGEVSGDDVIIYMPEMRTEEECVINDVSNE